MRAHWKTLQCMKNRLGECDIDFAARKNCSACRLKKCLDIGMQRELNSELYNRSGSMGMKGICDVFHA